MQRPDTKTLAIKARLANYVRKTLYKKKLEEITPEQKIALFDELHNLNHEMHYELVFYHQKRRKKRQVREEREKRGWKSKKHPLRAGEEKPKAQTS